MKLFRKKNKPALERRTQAAPDPAANIYDRNKYEATLDEQTSAPGAQHIRRTSKSSPGRRRETSNRASDWAIALLLLRAALIVLLLAGGFVVLRIVLTRLSEPSEKDRQRWDEKARLMQPAAAAAPAVATEASPGTEDAAEMVRKKLQQWALADRHFRAADGFSLRAIDDQTLEELNQALQSSPDNQRALQLLLDLYMKKEMFAEAVPVCIRLMDQTGPQAELQMNLLRALQFSGQMDAALVLAEDMLKDQPDNEAILAVAAAGQVALGKTDEALETYKRILQRNDKNKDALNGCGTIYFNRGDYEQAISCFLELIRIDPAPDYYRTLALCYALQNQSGKAVVCMGQAYSLFGGAVVAPWVGDSGFDTIRETVDFRSFTARLTGSETRKAVAAMNKREAEKKEVLPSGPVLPQQPVLQLNPNK